ncbi:MAG TPA: DUF4215 domain-containing protein [Polyangiaceae bacterium]|nr:DUF4215 domain-containing protein [Polyangiaceae bacterium]
MAASRALRTASILCLLAPTWMFACSAPPADGADDTSTDDSGDFSEDLPSDGSGGTPSNLDDDPPTPNCANGVRDPDEACDDGNQTNGDGCWGNCRGLDPGFTCPTPGELCEPFARCGDGIVSFPEQCDDGASAAGDGCAANCKFEIGYVCEPGEDGKSSCRPTDCGDGIIEGTETCEDGNREPFDGCSSLCIAEPNCATGACTSSCGDGIVLGEECDDGNRIDGDGCSKECLQEQGYVCAPAAACDPTDPSCVMRISAVFRDFDAAHSDFEEGACGGSTAVTGLLNDQLTGGKPTVKNAANGQCMTNFAQWYTTNGSVNTALVSELVLYPNAQGTFANRYGKNGEQFHSTVQSCSGACLFDGNPFFFPVDGIPGARDNGGLTAAVSVVGQYGMDGTTHAESVFTGTPTKHNFGYTSEIISWFQYKATSSPQLTFLGDDDLWVFINGRLALDLGGVHSTVSGSVTLDTAKAAQLGLQDGKFYEIAIFHAERKSNGSTFRLTLSQFAAGRSNCESVCGDGIIGFPEECDDGVNDGGYNECQPGCKLGGYCGDGERQENEQCDDAEEPRVADCRGCFIQTVN